jgi:quercetin dioxygenase-like cupin family protein
MPLERDYFIPNWRVRTCKMPQIRTSPRWKENTMQLFSWDKVKKDVMSEKISRKIITGEKAMLGQIFIAKGGSVPTHHHESEQLTYIMEGAMQFELEGKEVVVHKGEVLHIPSNVPHSAVALEDTLDLDIFSPIRMDWLTGNDGYLRGK